MQFGNSASPSIGENTLHGWLSKLLSDTSLGFYTSDIRSQFLNQAYREINEDLKPIRKYQGIPVPPASAGNAMPNDFMALASGGITWASNANPGVLYKLERRGVVELDQEWNGWQTSAAARGTPYFYHFEPQNPTGYTAILIPTPNEAGTMRVEYHPSYADLVDPTSEPWGGTFEGFHHLIVYKAEAFCRNLEGDEAAEARALQRYALHEKKFIRALSEIAPPTRNTLIGNRYRQTFMPGGR